MSKKLLGKNGYEVGSVQYFEKLLEEAGIDGWKKDLGCTAYKGMVQELGKRAVAVLEGLYKDLYQHRRILRYLEVDARGQTVQAVQNFSALIAFSGGGSSKKDACVALLRLKHRETGLESKLTEKAFRDAVRSVEKNKTMALSKGVGLLEKAMGKGVQAVAMRDAKTMLFFGALPSVDRDLCTDLWRYFNYQQNGAKVKAACGETLCSKKHIQSLEKMIFGAAAAPALFPTNYVDMVQKKFRALSGCLETDVSSGVGSDDYMVYDARKRAKDAGRVLQGLGVKMPMSFAANVDRLRRLEDFDNKVIVINDIGDNFTVEAQLKWEKGRNTLYLTAHVVFQIFVPPKMRADTIEGFLKWNRPACTVFGGQQVEVKVEVKAVVDTKDRNRNDIIVYAMWPGFRPLAYGGGDLDDLWNWNKAERDKLMLLERDGSEPIDTAKHEFGHILGLGDMYEDKDLGLEGVKYGDYADIDQYYLDGEFNMVMNRNGNITDNDIEMVIRAFQTGKRQNYQVQNLKYFSTITEVSDVLGR